MSIYAVNGKEPIAAWIPSLDTSGNGTTTLTDLVGSNDGTLTNMDAATDWPADTGAGGVRALDFDGSNDGVVITGVASTTTKYSLSLWAKSSKTNQDRDALIDFGGLVFAWGTNTAGQIGWYDNSNWRSLGSTPNDGNWHHIVFLFDGGGTGSAYIDGVLTGTGAAAAVNIPAIVGQTSRISHSRNLAAGWGFEGRLDDIRLFEALIDTSDIAYLYNSGTGRGIVVSTGAPAQNAQHNNLRNIRMAP